MGQSEIMGRLAWREAQDAPPRRSTAGNSLLSPGSEDEEGPDLPQMSKLVLAPELCESFAFPHQCCSYTKVKSKKTVVQTEK